MKRILFFTTHYFPGFLSGGIAQTVFNTAEWLGNDFEFFIVTQDRDLQSDKPYNKIKYGRWVKLGNSHVRYLSPIELSFSSLRKLINEIDHDILHLNSFFDIIFTLKILILLRFNLINSRKIILSPRGEFVYGPLHIKYFKKKIFIFLLKFLGFYNKIVWHASTTHEALGIVDQIGVSINEIKLAIDLPIRNPDLPKTTKATSKTLQIAFISRITREKNLDGAIRILKQVKSNVSFDIIGPHEDPVYWDECKELIKELPKNISIRILGIMNPRDKFKYFSSYDLLLFPTHGENYGHVIAESISAGTRVLISQSTPWRNLAADGIGWDLDKNNRNAFVCIIEMLAQQPLEDRLAIRSKVCEAAKVRLSAPKAFIQNRNLYLKE